MLLNTLGKFCKYITLFMNAFLHMTRQYPNHNLFIKRCTLHIRYIYIYNFLNSGTVACSVGHNIVFSVSATCTLFSVMLFLLLPTYCVVIRRSSLSIVASGNQHFTKPLALFPLRTVCVGMQVLYHIAYNLLWHISSNLN